MGVRHGVDPILKGLGLSLCGQRGPGQDDFHPGLQGIQLLHDEGFGRSSGDGRRGGQGLSGVDEVLGGGRVKRCFPAGVPA